MVIVAVAVMVVGVAGVFSGVRVRVVRGRRGTSLSWSLGHSIDRVRFVTVWMCGCGVCVALGARELGVQIIRMKGTH